MISTLENRAAIEEAYYEYRRACYLIIWRHARERGLLDLLRQPMTLDEVEREFKVLPERRLALELLLRALARFGAVEQEGSPVRFRARPDFSGDDGTLDVGLIARAIGLDKVDALVHSKSYKGIIDTFSESENKVSADFVAANLALWDEFLQQPFYAFGRQAAVEAIAKPGARVLDVACGLGFGLVELAEAVGPSGEVVGVEYSHDFVIESEKRIGGMSNVRCLRGDADEGMGFLQEGYFDGAMLIGAYHFLKRKDRIFETVARLLRPGGRFVIGYAYIERGTYDQELMDLRMLLREPKAAPTTRAEVERLASAAGLKLVSDAGTIGCFGWFLLEKA